MEIRPDDSQLFDYMEGNLPPEQHAAVQKYLEEHGDCRSELDAAQHGAGILEKFKVSASIDITSDVMHKINMPSVSTSYLKYILLITSFLAAILVVGLFLKWPAAENQATSPVVLPELQKPDEPVELPDVIAQATYPATGAAIAPDSGTIETAYFESIRLAAGESRVIEHEKIGTVKLAGPGNFNVAEDKVEIAQGRVFFDIKPRDYKKPFSVSTEDANVVVIGTKFGVAKDLQGTSVVLLQGKLRIELPGSNHDLESHESATIAGTLYTTAKVTDQEVAFWSRFPAALNPAFGKPESLPDSSKSPAPKFKQPLDGDESTTPDPSENRSPLDLLNEWSVQPPKSGP